MPRSCLVMLTLQRLLLRVWGSVLFTNVTLMVVWKSSCRFQKVIQHSCPEFYFPSFFVRGLLLACQDVVFDVVFTPHFVGIVVGVKVALSPCVETVVGGRQNTFVPTIPLFVSVEFCRYYKTITRSGRPLFFGDITWFKAVLFVLKVLLFLVYPYLILWETVHLPIMSWYVGRGAGMLNSPVT